MPNSCPLPPKKPTGKPTSTTSSSSSAEKSRLIESRLLQKLWDEHKKIPRPNKHKDRSGWNLHFEREISLKWAFHERDLFDESIPRLRWPWETSSIEELNHTIAFSSDGLMVQEGILIALAVENLVDHDFEKGWNELDVEKKKEKALEGLYRGACACPRDNSRTSCPEMTIDGLAGGGEYNFINLLKRIVVHDATANGCVRELYLFSHPFVEREFALSDDAPDKERAFVTSMVILRNFYIVEALIGILEAYMTTLRTEERREAKNIARAEARKGAYRVDDSQVRENATVSKNACASCYKTTGNRSELKKCSRCQLTWYCSRDCQRNDWNTHKVFCGKRHFEPEVLAPKPKGPKLFIGCPDSEPGFVRSPALWRQIQYLGGDDSQTQVCENDRKRIFELKKSCPSGWIGGNNTLLSTERLKRLTAGASL
ncbi:hypothetical protein B0H13DRAFT_1865200 [Mycena leptocephala]|nr:hypothetical protein B0H13DRAFT_1865200 [Mycena leptocephala]